MYVLGISCFYHDAAAALLSDGMLVAAAEEERFTRRKHDQRFPSEAIAFCLEHAGITAHDLDYVVFYEKPLRKFERIVLTSLSGAPRTWGVFRGSMQTWLRQKLWMRSLIQRRLGIPAEKLLFTEHHVSHAASALLCSPFEEAALLSVDGVGEWTTTAIGHGHAPFDGGPARMELDQELRFPHSLGLLYSAFTAFLGFEVNEGEYKVMGMAPYGEPRFVDKIHTIMDVKDDGSFHLDLRYFSFHHSTSRMFSNRFVELFGQPRPPNAEFITHRTHPQVKGRDEEMAFNQHYADVAASVQQVTEEMALKLAWEAYNATGLKKLCMAGGVALNCTANGRILREGPFDEVFIQPAAGDSGGALGAALYVHNVILGHPRRFVMEHAYWGKAYDQAAVLSALNEAGAAYEVVEDEESLSERVVDRLVAGDVVGWFDAEFEWGPRALGHRSILADPRRAEMKDIVNRKIKFREPFRPFAPAVLMEQTQTYFDLPAPEKNYLARYMLQVAPVRPERAETIPAVNHCGTARVQTVRHAESPRYYRLIQDFGEATGVPVLLNTSFNLRGEPIVNTPGEALASFRAGNMELLVLGNILVGRTD